LQHSFVKSSSSLQFLNGKSTHAKYLTKSLKYHFWITGRKSKSKGRSKSPIQSSRRCWKCGKVRHYKREFNLKAMEVNTGSDEKQSTERKMTPNKGCDVYLASTSTYSYQDVWLIDLGESYHVTPHREWFYEYEQYEYGDVFLGDNSTTKIVEQGRV
jgi:hypothetical protein